MSSGHHHHEAPTVSMATMDRILRNPQVQQHLFRPYEENNEFDIPYIAGYSKDGGTVFFDRHLPEITHLRLDGNTREIQPRHFLKYHETLEKALIDALGWGYHPAHAAATAYERRAIFQQLGPQWWMPYQHEMDGFAKADEHEKVKTVPKNLDMTPYETQPVSRKLLAVMHRAQGGSGRVDKESKESVKYEAVGHPSSHCGPTPNWPSKGQCVHFKPPYGCELVQGYISPKGWCELWQGQKD